MTTVYKYAIDFMHMSVDMPEGAKILYCGTQNTFSHQGEPELLLWAEIDDSKPTVKRDFAIVGTGHMVPDGMKYIGTVQERVFVWHIYELAS